MKTIRQWLNEVDAGFDWDTGQILWQKTEPSRWREAIRTLNEPIGARLLEHDDPLLDLEFSTGYGSASCPRFIAWDEKRIYFVSTYDGATELEYIFRDPLTYMDFKGWPIPVPGGE